MPQYTPDQQALLDEATQTQSAFDLAEQRLEGLRALRVQQMRDLHEAGVSWAQIGRTFGMSPQAAMYATGHAKRQVRAPKKAAGKQGGPGAAPSEG